MTKKLTITITKEVTVPPGQFSYDPATEVIICGKCGKFEDWPPEGDRVTDQRGNLENFIERFVRAHMVCLDAGGN